MENLNNDFNQNSNNDFNQNSNDFNQNSKKQESAPNEILGGAKIDLDTLTTKTNETKMDNLENKKSSEQSPEQSPEKSPEMFYTFNPLKNTIIAFKEKTELNLYLKYDPKNYEKKKVNGRIEISAEQKEDIIREKRSFFFISKTDQIKDRIEKVEEWTNNQIEGKSKDNVTYPEDQRFSFLIIEPDSKKTKLGLIVEITNKQKDELGETDPELFKNEIKILNPKENKEDKQIVNTAKVNGNYISYGDNRKPESFLKTVSFAMKDYNFNKLNPSYNKFVAITTKEGKNPQILRFASDTARYNFLKKSTNILRKANQDIQENQQVVKKINNFSSQAVYSVSQNKTIDMYKKSTNDEAISNILKVHKDTINYNKTEQNRYQPEYQKPQQNKAITR